MPKRRADTRRAYVLGLPPAYIVGLAVKWDPLPHHVELAYVLGKGGTDVIKDETANEFVRIRPSNGRLFLRCMHERGQVNEPLSSQNVSKKTDSAARRRESSSQSAGRPQKATKRGLLNAYLPTIGSLLARSLVFSPVLYSA